MAKTSPASREDPIELRTITIVWDGVELAHTYVPTWPESSKTAMDWLQFTLWRAVVKANPATLLQIKVDRPPWQREFPGAP